MNAETFAIYREFGERRREAAPGSLEHKSGGIILELCAEVDRQRALSQRNLEAYWEEQGKTTNAERDSYIAKFRTLERDWQLEREQVVLMTQRAEAAEAKLAAVPMADIQRMTGCEAHTEGTELAKIRVQEWLRKNGRHGFWPPEDFRQ